MKAPNSHKLHSKCLFHHLKNVSAGSNEPRLLDVTSGEHVCPNVEDRRSCGRTPTTPTTAANGRLSPRYQSDPDMEHVEII